METPKIIRTDNGSGYVSKAFMQFCTQWNIKHKTGISYNTQGQGIVEHAMAPSKHNFKR